MGEILDGKRLSDIVKDQVTGGVNDLKNNGINASLCVIIIGDDPASQVYVRNKAKGCEQTGIRSKIVRMSETSTQTEVLAEIGKYNNDPSWHGILLQLPIPGHLNEFELTQAISEKKDVDGFNIKNSGALAIGVDGLMPCTPSGCIEIIKHYGIEISGKNALVVGRSNIVGKPVSLMLLKENATVTIAHSKTKDLKKLVSEADILVAAIGIAKHIKGDWIKKDAIVIDVGMNRDAEGKLCGDVEFDVAKDRAAWITPVPGGIGPMTIAMLLKNTVKAAKIQNQKEL